MSELAPLIRIFLYIAGTWLAARGAPSDLVKYITTEPAMIELISQAVGVAVTAFAFIWYRIAKRFGGAT